MARIFLAKRTFLLKAKWKASPWHTSRTTISLVRLQYKMQENEWQEMRGLDGKIAVLW